MMDLEDMQSMLVDLRDDFDSFRKSISMRLNYLEDSASPDIRREALRIQMDQEIKEFRHGRQ